MALPTCCSGALVLTEPFKALHASLKHCSVVSRLISTGELTPAKGRKQRIYEVAVVALAAV